MRNQLAHEKYNYYPNLITIKTPEITSIHSTPEKKLKFTTALFWTLVTPILLILFVLTPFILFYGGLFLVGDYPLIQYFSSDTQALIARYIPDLYPYLR